MQIAAHSPSETADAASPACPADEARKRNIVQAIWTEIHWLMPRDRTVAITVDGDDIDVTFGPPGAAGQPTPH